MEGKRTERAAFRALFCWTRHHLHITVATAVDALGQSSGSITCELEIVNINALHVALERKKDRCCKCIAASLPFTKRQHEISLDWRANWKSWVEFFNFCSTSLSTDIFIHPASHRLTTRRASHRSSSLLNVLHREKRRVLCVSSLGAYFFFPSHLSTAMLFSCYSFCYVCYVSFFLACCFWCKTIFPFVSCLSFPFIASTTTSSSLAHTPHTEEQHKRLRRHIAHIFHLLSLLFICCLVIFVFSQRCLHKKWIIHKKRRDSNIACYLNVLPPPPHPSQPSNSLLISFHHDSMIHMWSSKVKSRLQ